MDLSGRLTPASPSQLSRSPVGRPSQGTNHKALEFLAWTKGPLLRSKQKGSPSHDCREDPCLRPNWGPHPRSAEWVTTLGVNREGPPRQV